MDLPPERRIQKWHKKSIPSKFSSLSVGRRSASQGISLDPGNFTSIGIMSRVVPPPTMFTDFFSVGTESLSMNFPYYDLE
jgi:hypothetical protein